MFMRIVPLELGLLRVDAWLCHWVHFALKDLGDGLSVFAGGEDMHITKDLVLTG